MMKLAEVDHKIQLLAEYIMTFEVPPVEEVINQLRKQVLILALQQEGGNQARTAFRLGLHRNSLHNQIVRYGVKQ